MSNSPTFAQLQVVLAVAEEQSFSRAARRLVVAQSSLSRTVAELERSWGVRLFERTTRRVSLTEAGTHFVHMAERVLAAYDAELAHFRGHLDGSVGVLRIAALPSLAATLLPQVVTRYRAQHPHVRIEVEDVLASEVAAAVREGRVDLALTAATVAADTAPSEVAGLPFAPLAVDRFVCLVAPDHPLARLDVVAWERLADEAFVSFDDASSVRVIVDTVLTGLGVEPLRRVSARNIASVAGLCAAGLGVTAVPALVLPLMEFAGLAAVPLEDPVVRRHVGVLTDPRRPTTAPTRALFDVLAQLRAVPATLPPGAAWVT